MSYDGYTHVTKLDRHFKVSTEHPVLDNPPRTAEAVSCKRKLANENSTVSATISENNNLH